jgi:predicted NUDIX family NTP pyrophosphohydrolase
MAKQSAGLMMYRKRKGMLEVLLVHMGGPYWARKDAGAWTIPKGGVEPGEDLLDTAKREFTEETGLTASGEFVELGSVKQKSGKIVTAWAFEGDCEPATIQSNTFTMEWPPRSGKQQEFPEIDRADFFGLDAARAKILESEADLVRRLEETVGKK